MVVVMMVKVVTVNMAVTMMMVMILKMVMVVMAMMVAVMVMVVVMAMMVAVMVIIVHHAFFSSLIPACLFFLLSFSNMYTYLPYRAQLSEPLWHFD